MTITHEQLELAALAGGINIEHFDEGIPVYYVDFRGLPNREYFEPHTDIADAARLAIRRAVTTMFRVDGHVLAFVPPGLHPVEVHHDGTEADKERAYCEAITLCVAEIGRQMKAGA